MIIVGKGDDPYRMAREVLREFPLPSLKRRKVLIKPNAGRVALPGDGVTTHPKVVEAVIDEFLKRGVERIAIGESCIFGVDSEEAFRATGMKEVSERKGVPLIDLDRERPIEIRIPDGRVLNKIKVSSIVKDFDFIVSVPVMKTHMHTRVSLSLKNMKGLLWQKEKARLHQLPYEKGNPQGDKALDIAISDMALALFPNLAIIDGLVGMEGMGPAYGVKKNAGLIVIGDNPLSTDAVASRLMGFRTGEIPHLTLTQEKGLGEIEVSKILITPKDYLKWETPFKPPPSQISFGFPDLVIYDEGACSACLSTLFVLLHHFYDELFRYRLEDGKIHIGLGKHFNHLPNGTILIGNCTSKMKKSGILIQGCPPVPSQIIRSLKRKA